jgi:hypothetical protein
MAITLDGTSGINASGSLTTASSLTTGTGAIYNGIQASTAVASTSGTSIDFTSIPSWAKRITIMFNGVSTNGTSNYLVQIGSGSVVTSGYVSGAIAVQASTATVGNNSTAGFIVTASRQGAGQNEFGLVIISLVSGFVYLSTGNITDNGSANTTRGNTSSGTLTLSGILDRVRITTVNGTDTFDAGSINILYE